MRLAARWRHAARGKMAARWRHAAGGKMAARWRRWLLAAAVLSFANAAEDQCIEKPAEETRGAGAGEVESAASGARFLCSCDLSATCSAVWRRGEEPEHDCLDEFAVYKTGCSYAALRAGASSSTARGVALAAGFSWRGALRATHAAVVRLLWRREDRSTRGYAFYIGREFNNETILYNWHPWRELERRPTAAVLAAGRYVPFYLTVDAAGVVRFGRECDEEPLFRRETDIERDAELRVQVEPFSPHGAKYLLCPP